MYNPTQYKNPEDLIPLPVYVVYFISVGLSSINTYSVHKF
jgi:hypothetical protein